MSEDNKNQPSPEEVSEEQREKSRKRRRKKKKKKKKKKTNPFVAFLKFIGGLFLIMIIVGMIGVIAGGIYLYPEFESISEEMTEILNTMDSTSFLRAGNTEIYDASGVMIGQYGNEKYEYVDLEDISSHVINGYISTEDERFYSHIGFDLQGTIRAAIALLRNRGSITQGGSTITQQLIKNNLLTSERSYRRKILEIVLAIQLERIYTKEEILELYCNSCYYGNGCYGIEGASNYYFGKHASELTPAEAAVLCGTSNSPNNYNPIADYEKAMKKKTQILGNMVEQGYLSNAEYQEGLAEEPELAKRTGSSFTDSYQNSYTVHCAALILMEQAGFEFQYLFDSEDAYNEYKTAYDEMYAEMANEVRQGGYTIRTSLDSEIQEDLQTAVDRNLMEFTDKAEDGRYEMQGAAVCIDNETQMVVAIVGGRGADDTYNRGFISIRQPGSAIKPILDYGPALDAGVIEPNSVINDSRIQIDDYAPINFGGSIRGDLTVREAIARSTNTIALKSFWVTGQEQCMSYLAQMQFRSINDVDSNEPSIALGGFDKGVRVVDMARGFATLANEGAFSPNTCIKSIEHFKKGVVYSATTETTQVYREDTAYMVTDMLQGVFQESYGTGRRYSDDSQYYAGKTGTTNENMDAWFCGYSAYYTTAVWVGMDMPQSVDGLSGNSYPAAIWSDFMTVMHSDLEKKDFNMPDTLYLKKRWSSSEVDIDYTEDLYDSRPYNADYRSRLIDYDDTLVDFDDYFDDEIYDIRPVDEDEDEDD